MAIIETRIAYSNNLSDAWRDAMPQLLDDLLELAGGGITVTGITLGSYLGKVCIQWENTFVDSGDGYAYKYVAINQDDGTIVPLRFFCQGSGIQSANGFGNTDAPYQDAILDAWQTWLIDGKMTIIGSGTDAAPPTATFADIGPAAEMRKARNSVITAQSNSDVCIIQDLYTTYLWTEFTPNPHGVLQYVQPTAASGSSTSISLAETNELLKDIALRDFQISFNHGAQQFSATGGVAIP